MPNNPPVPVSPEVSAGNGIDFAAGRKLASSIRDYEAKCDAATPTLPVSPTLNEKHVALKLLDELFDYVDTNNGKNEAPVIYTKLRIAIQSSLASGELVEAPHGMARLASRTSGVAP